MPSKIETHQDLTIDLLGSFVHKVRLLKRHGQRLLNEHMLACVEGSQSNVGMRLNRNTYCNNVDRGRIQKRA
jgi:hypothetical protein